MNSIITKPCFRSSSRPQSTELVMDSPGTSHTIAQKARTDHDSARYPQRVTEPGALQSMLDSIDKLAPPWTRLRPRPSSVPKGALTHE